MGPVWREGLNNEDMLLESCYRECLRIAAEHPDIQSIAFPGISTGIFAFPADRAAKIAVETCKDSDLDITFCCFSKAHLDLYQALLEE